MTVSLTLDGTPRTLVVAPGETLLDALRAAGVTGVKRGCEQGTCGACAVLVDGVPRLSCLMLAAMADGHAVTTAEGLGTPDRPHPIQAAFADAGAIQCGYCIPGMIVSAKALLDRNPRPDDDEIREALDGHLCRCTGYVKQSEAVRRAAEALAAGGRPSPVDR